MPSTRHMATSEDDWRHVPAPGSLPLWNESFWFPFYDPKAEIGVVLRAGIHANKREANLFLVLTHRGEIVHAFVDHRLPVPPIEDKRLAIGGLVIDWERPLERFRLRYAQGAHGMDVVWEASSPTYLYPAPPGTTADEVARHIEQGGTVTGTVTLGGTSHAVDCLAHRDHTWGGERDWEKFYRWNYLSGEFGSDFWFNAVRISFGPDVPYLFIGCLWDGHEVLALTDIAMDIATTDGGTRQLGADVRLTDERGRQHHIVGEEVLVIVPVRYGRTWLKDGITRYRCGDRVAYGILEHGYVEDG